MECEVTPVKITGTVIFMPSNANSKSEAVLPYLYNNKNEVVQIYFEGDNPAPPSADFALHGEAFGAITKRS